MQVDCDISSFFVYVSLQGADQKEQVMASTKMLCLESNYSRENLICIG